VTATWNGEAVTGLPPLKVATADVMSVTLSPTAKGFAITADSISFPFHGTLRITNGGKTQNLPLDLDGGVKRELAVSGDPGLPTTVSAVSAKGEVVAQTPLRHFVLLGGMPKAVTDPSGFDIVPCPKNIPAPPTPAGNVAAGDGAPGPTSVSMPYATTPSWLYTLLKPHGGDGIPNNATEIVVWVKSGGDKSHINARYIDATGQTFQPGMGNLDFEGWRALRYALRGITYCWGGAGDGVQHLPLKLDSLVNIDGTRLPDSQKTVLVGPAFYAIDDVQATK
jgi:hypothetical protein